MTTWTVTPEPFGTPVALSLWRAYYTEVSDRWFLLYEGHVTEPEELERAIAAESGAELAPPDGALLLGCYDGVPAGCVGLRPVAGDPRTRELTRMFVLPGYRGKGGAALLLGAAEEAARRLGARRLVLDTRHDLVEARALYARHGYTETEPTNSRPYAEHWFQKDLGTPHAES